MRMGQPLRVLIVEDSQDDAELVLLELKSAGFDVSHERVDTPKAMKVALGKPWDIVISDYVMPRFSGLAALNLVTKQGLDLPFIIVSGKIGEETAIEAMKLGACDYVLKNKMARLPEAVRRELFEAENRRKRRQVESALRESEERLRLAQSTGRMGDWEFDIETNTITWSDETYNLYERDKSLGPPTPEEEAKYYTPEHATMTRDFARRAIENGEEFAYDLAAKLPSGRTTFFNATMHPKRDESGHVVKLFGTIHDITERKHAENALRQNEERFRSMIEKGSDVILIVDRDLAITYVSPSFKPVLGRDVSEIEGHSAYEFIEGFVHPDDLESLAEAIADCTFEPGVERRAEVRINHSDGTEHYIVAIGKNHIDNPAIGGIVISIRDITVQKLASKALRESEERFRELFENMGSGVAIYKAIDDGEDFVFTGFNKAAERIEGATRDWILGRKVTEIFPGVKDFELFKIIQDVYRTGLPAFLPISEYKDARTSGRWRENFVYKLSTGEIVAIYSDVTEQVKAQQSLVERTVMESRYTLTKTMTDVIPLLMTQRSGAQGRNEFVRELMHRLDVAFYGRYFPPGCLGDLDAFGGNMCSLLNDMGGDFSYRPSENALELTGRACPWHNESAKNPLLCLMCRGMVERFSNNTLGRMTSSQISSMVEGNPSCVFHLTREP
jgi:PAS domain S-box-containing protein